MSLPLFRKSPITNQTFDPHQRLVTLDIKTDNPEIIHQGVEYVKNYQHQGSNIIFSEAEGKVFIQNDDLVGLAADTSNFMRGRMVNVSLLSANPSGEPLVHSDDTFGSLSQIENILKAIGAHASHINKQYIEAVADAARQDFIAKSS